MRFRPTDVELSPDVFAAVMATGIMSLSALDHRYRWISDVLAGLAVAAFALIILLVVVGSVVHQRFSFHLGHPDVTVRLFTFVAAGAVLGARFEDHPMVIWTLAAAAWWAWSALVPLTIRNMWPLGWVGLRDRAHGAWELVSVATSGLAIVTAHLALLSRDRALLAVGFAAWLLAMGIYGLMTWLILWRAAAAPTENIWRADSWILMGGLAIATLAGDRLHFVALSLGAGDEVLGAVRSVAVATWVLATVWIPPLVYLTVRHLRMELTASGWAMVFPLGMYSAATFAMLVETRWEPFKTTSLVFFWIAFAVWVWVSLRTVEAACRWAQAG